MDSNSKVVILMGSPSDQSHVDLIIAQLNQFEIPTEVRVASAHKTPGKLLKIIQEYQNSLEWLVLITVAGRSNALSGMVDANVSWPVIACPPPSDAFGGADIFSSLRMPSGVCPMLVLDPANAALAAAKILGLGDTVIKGRVQELQQTNAAKLDSADLLVNKLNG